MRILCKYTFAQIFLNCNIFLQYDKIVWFFKKNRFNSHWDQLNFD